MKLKKIFYTVVSFAVVFLVGYGLFIVYENVRLNDRIAHEGLFKTDSIYTNRKYKIKIINDIQKPNTVVVYNKPDTILRNIVENDTIITGVTITENQISIEKIDAKGIVCIDTYKIDPDRVKKIEINNKGQLQFTTTKPFWLFCKKQLKWIVPIGCILVGVVIGGAVTK